jgi:hypothetical protein
MRGFLTVVCAGALFLSVGCPNPDDMPPGAGGSGAATPGSDTDTSGEGGDADSDADGDNTSASSGGDRGKGKVARPPRETDASHVKVGQKWFFQTTQSQMTIDEVWKITSVSDTEVHYELTSSTRMAPMEGVPDSDPIENGPTPKVFLLSREDAPPAPGEPPKLIGTKVVEINGIKFDCQVFEGKTAKQLISKRFPRLIRMERDDRPFKRLVKIEQ